MRKKSSDKCALMWVTQSAQQWQARSQVFFEGAVIYSYGRHFPMARRITNKRGEEAMLVNESRYSNTTCKHQSSVSMAIHRHFSGPVFHASTAMVKEFSDNPQTHAMHLGYRVQRIKDAYAKAMKARGRKPQYVEEAMQQIELARAWAKFFSLPEPFLISDPAMKLAVALDDADSYLAALVSAGGEVGPIKQLLEVSARHLNIGG